MNFDIAAMFRRVPQQTGYRRIVVSILLGGWWTANRVELSDMLEAASERSGRATALRRKEEGEERQPEAQAQGGDWGGIGLKGP